MHSENILLVDDNELLLLGMNRALAKSLYKVTAVCTGEEALLLIKNNLYHIIILDINLPCIDGWEVLSVITFMSPESKVIIMSGCGEENARKTALERGALEYLEKPFELAELKNILVKICSYSDRDRRIYKSFPIVLKENYSGLAQNLSVSGMYVMTDLFAECGTMVSMQLPMPEAEPIKLEGQVVRNVPVPSASQHSPSKTSGSATDFAYGLSLQLVETSARYTDLINSFIPLKQCYS